MPFQVGNKLRAIEGPEPVATALRLGKSDRAILNQYLESQGIEPTDENCREAIRQMFWHTFGEIKEKLDRNETLIY
jgi:hypothetical protein